ncbi:dTDP-4-dehydrorhamnose reductase [Cellulomonas soli]|uniref:dTDP-4-dehydrorhamnose reductase n=1 Tax=Cellulomonas soli TaxID=931535 RepID=A0A512P7Y4_9CELL|nr:dTDP-4-dehydrorhamnose reductase [Cellulomonas soli]NYI57542.1 dTDP-4-dehydrorhamnose reductase [Cellulomonas soli]GEP67319.1 dTDP-4-dehydrorhamnose reductase [Cellulomonas soli]
MRWLVVGASGMLGRDLTELLARRGHLVVGVDRDELDITDPVAVGLHVRDVDVVANCAAWTAVDAAEEREPDAFAVNALGAAYLAAAATKVGARLVQVSTDYVFGGDATTPYAEDDAPAPRSAYGRTKLAGEWAVAGSDHLVVRTAWLYGRHGSCFPRTIARVAAERGALDVVADQVGQPTWTGDLADLVERLVVAAAPAGVYHGTSSGSGTWWEFAREVVATAGLDPQIVRPTTSEASTRAAVRPSYSVLGHDALVRAGVDPIGDWRERWSTAGSLVLAG